MGSEMCIRDRTNWEVLSAALTVPGIIGIVSAIVNSLYLYLFGLCFFPLTYSVAKLNKINNLLTLFHPSLFNSFLYFTDITNATNSDQNLDCRMN